MHEFTKREKKLLWNNRHFWVGHSKWMVKLMRVVDWDNPSQTAEALALLRCNKRWYSDCWATMCSRPCSSRIGTCAA